MLIRISSELQNTCLKHIFNVLYSSSLYLSIFVWYVVFKHNIIPRSSCVLLQNWDVTRLVWSDELKNGTPCFFIILSSKNFFMDHVSCVAKKSAILVNLLMITQIMLCPFFFFDNFMKKNYCNIITFPIWHNQQLLSWVSPCHESFSYP